MSINGIKPVGDDQEWKRQAEIELAELRDMVNILSQQVTNIDKRQSN